MNYLSRILAVTLILTLTITSCKKDDEDVVVAPPKTTVFEFGANDETARYEYDNTMDDLFSWLNHSSIETGKGAQPDSGVILPCGVVRIDSTGGVFKFVYDTTCGIRVLSGSISVRLSSGTTWSQQGAELEFTFTNYEIYYKKNGQTLTFNGPMYVTNTTGGKIANLIFPPIQSSVVHSVKGTINITFDQLDTRKWRIRKKRLFEKDINGKLKLTLDQDSSVAEVGSTRNGDPFTASITTPVEYINCGSTFEGPYIATIGTLVYATNNTSMTAEAGYVYSNNTATFAGDCTSEGYKLTYTILGRQVQSFQYY